jgi:hypothetical protein
VTFSAPSAAVQQVNRIVCLADRFTGTREGTAAGGPVKVERLSDIKPRARLENALFYRTGSPFKATNVEKVAQRIDTRGGHIRILAQIECRIKIWSRRPALPISYENVVRELVDLSRIVCRVPSRIPRRLEDIVRLPAHCLPNGHVVSDRISLRSVVSRALDQVVPAIEKSGAANDHFQAVRRKLRKTGQGHFRAQRSR